MDKELAWKRLRRFRSRAKRIADTDIARRADLATLGTTLQVMTRVGTPWATIFQEHPPEAEIITGATLLRPVFLKEEDVYHHNVISALGFLVRDRSPEAKKAVANCKETWKAATRSSYWAFEAALGENLEDRMPQTWDRDIAKDWLVADIVHDDEDAQHRLRLVSETDKILAGLLWVKDGILLVRGTDQLIVDLEDKGELAPN